MYQNFVRSNRLKTAEVMRSIRILGSDNSNGIPFRVLFHPIREKKSCCEKSKKGGSSEKLFSKLSDPITISHKKITVVGVGSVGMACVFSLLTKNVTNDIALIDKDKKALEGENLDIQQGALFLKNYNIQASSDDYSITKNSQICIITAGARQKEGESRLNLVQRNADIYKSIIPELVKHSPDTILLIVSNPVDILTYIAWKLSCFPVHRIIGSGTHLDTARFRFLLSQKLKIAPSDCHGWIIGEHGDNSVPVWSSVNVSGMNLNDLNPNFGTCDDTERWAEMHKEVVESAGTVIKLKGFTNWAIALGVTDICICILNNLKSLCTISTLVKGFYGIEDDVFLSLPASLGENGIIQVVKQKLEKTELCSFQNSAKIIADINSKVKL